MVCSSPLSLVDVCPCACRFESLETFEYVCGIRHASFIHEPINKLSVSLNLAHLPLFITRECIELLCKNEHEEEVYCEALLFVCVFCLIVYPVCVSTCLQSSKRQISTCRQ